MRFKIHSNLTEEQDKHLDSVKWLFYGPRGVGRTRLLAHVFLEQALQHQGAMIRVTDHHIDGRKQAIQNVLNEIRRILDESESPHGYEFDMLYFYQSECICYKGLKRV